ncbi:unnamed protein product [Pleuronectes platessa]|uniref:Uncharacterized protein n=1 Tax=Pleuronectes platessa TaxID=8262 RepID=A0A9N7TX61_PLEPL|nr:unnamed protein product [Pleuronectes platessa]
MAWRQEVDGVTAKGEEEEEGERMGEGYTSSRISDRQGLPPLREAITGGGGVAGGWKGDMLAGPATELIGNLLARPQADIRSRDRRMPARQEKSTPPGNERARERDVWSGWWRGGSTDDKTGEKREAQNV